MASVSLPGKLYLPVNKDKVLTKDPNKMYEVLTDLARRISQSHDELWVALRNMSLDDVRPGETLVTRISKEHYPYVTEWSYPPLAPAATVAFPEMRIQFFTTSIYLPAWSHTFALNSITDVWVDVDGNITYETVDDSDYPFLPRYLNQINIFRVQTGPTKVLGWNFRGDTRLIYKSVEHRPVNLQEILTLYYVGESNKSWGEIAVVGGDIVKTSLGNLYYVTNSGTLSALEPTVPVYELEDHAGFHEEDSGTAKILFIGHEAYTGAFRTAYMLGINWYFGLSGIGWIAKANGELAQALGDQFLNMIRAAVDLAINPWDDTHVYTKYALVTDSAGYVWQAQNAGTSAGSEGFPASPDLDDTYVDNDITWRCVGRTSLSGGATPVQWQLGDTDPTMKYFKRPDSHDSYSMILIWALEQLRSAGLVPDAFFTETSPVHGITYVEAIKNIIYYNVLTQISNNLTKTFQFDKMPDGSGDTYNTQFFMDNCEVYAGLVAAGAFYGDARYTADPTYSAYVAGFAPGILTGLNSLWDSTYERFKYYLGYDVANDPAPNVGQFYPWLMAQAWGYLYDVPFDYYKIRKCFDYMRTYWPDWWMKDDLDILPALGSHVAFYKYMQSTNVLNQILNRVEEERLRMTEREFYLQDLGFYVWLRSQKSLFS